MIRRFGRTSAAIGAIVLTASACSRRGDAKADASRPVTVPGAIPLSNPQTVLSDPAIGYILGIKLSGGRIWLVDAKGDPFFHIADTASRRILFSRGRRGTGPGDFQALRAIFPVGDTSRDMWAFDVNNRRIVRLTEDGLPETDRTINLGRGADPAPLVRVGRGWVGWTYNEDSTKRYVGFDERGVVSFTTPGPLLGDSTVRLRDRIKASATNQACARPSRDRFALLYGYAGRIEIRGPRAELIALAQVPDSSNGDFVTSRRGDRIWRSQKKFYSTCTATDEYLFALYSGKPTRDASGKPRTDYGESRYVHIFDWAGRFVGSLALDRGLTALAISDDGRWLYGGGYDSANVYRYPLPAIAPKPRP